MLPAPPLWVDREYVGKFVSLFCALMLRLRRDMGLPVVVHRKSANAYFRDPKFDKIRVNQCFWQLDYASLVSYHAFEPKIQCARPNWVEIVLNLGLHFAIGAAGPVGWPSAETSVCLQKYF